MRVDGTPKVPGRLEPSFTHRVGVLRTPAHVAGGAASGSVGHHPAVSGLRGFKEMGGDWWLVLHWPLAGQVLQRHQDSASCEGANSD